MASTSRLEDAVDEAVESLVVALGGARPDLLLAFAGAEYGDHASQLAPAIAERFPSAMLVGCSAVGVIGGGRESEGESALALMAAVLPDVEMVACHLGPDPDQWDDELTPGDDPAVLLVLPDPFTCPAAELVALLEDRYPGAVVVGGLASGAHGAGGTTLFCAGQVHRAGAVVLSLRGNIAVDTLVAQGCKPIGTPMFVTRCDGNVIFELDGEPAIGALERLYGTLEPTDQQLFRHSLLVGVVMSEDEERYDHGDFLIRNLVGIDPEVGAVAVGTPLMTNQVIQFHLRDADSATAELRALLAARAEDERSPDAALLLSCAGRGANLFGRPGHDSRLFFEALGELPLAGFFAGGEIGPVRGRSYLHGYTSVFALVRPADAV